MTNYGFVIDNRKCIGCHACTVACKAEHDVSVGVFRTWVKYIEKGEYPNTRRLFSVMRCNHCENAPCVNICPVTALYTREDGIVDFDGSRCIACKSCMQACPYDALYIDPKTQTAAKCNYCSNRVEVGLEPACVVVCPEQAIIPGDLDNPNSKISKLIAHETVSVRKEAKGTYPNVFYIDGDSIMLTPNKSTEHADYMWSSQASGVGHHTGHQTHMDDGKMDPKNLTKRVYDAPSKGRLWGWQVPAYLTSKSLGAGVGILAMMLSLFDYTPSNNFFKASYVSIIAFMVLTALFLVLDLDQPKRFHTVLLRPNWSSWLARGAYIITTYGALVSLSLLLALLDSSYQPGTVMAVILIVFALLTAVYTAFLFAQAKGRDFWQSPLLPFEMIIHSGLTGSAFILIMNELNSILSQKEADFTQNVLLWTAGLSLVFSLAELVITHPTEDAHQTAEMLRNGKYAKDYWLGIGLTSVLPLLLLSFMSFNLLIGIIAIIGVYVMNRTWVYAPQELSLI